LSGFWLVAPVAVLAIFDTEVLLLLLIFVAIYAAMWHLTEKVLKNE
jgi:hypothetical protein